jgi:hypothetical protein
VLDGPVLAEALGATAVPLPQAVLRAAAAATWRLRLQPSPPGWVDLAFGVPLLDTSRIRKELGWEPRRSAIEALRDLLAGLREGADAPTPPLAAETSGPLRRAELATGIGSRDDA